MKPRLAIVGTVGLLSLSLLGSLVLMSAAIQNSERFGDLYSILLLTNVLGLLAFGGLIVANARDLIRALRRRAPGARLMLRMLTIFVVLSVVPICVLFSFSLNFLMRGMDSWFDVHIDKALADAIELSRRALDLRTREVLNRTVNIAEEISAGAQPGSVLDLGALRAPGSTVAADTWDPGPTDLDLLRQRSGAEEMVLVTVQGRVLQSSSSATDLVPNLPSAAMLLQVKQGRTYVGLEPYGDDGLGVRVAVLINDENLDRGGRILQAIFPVASGMNQLATNVESAHAKYGELVYLRRKLKLSFAMTLTLVLLSSITSAIWAAFYSAKRLAAPISDLAAGTAAVATGNYAMNLPVTTSDDMGFLVSSFNDMTRRIATARSEVETQHRYLDTLLSQLSSGVLALDPAGRVTTINDAGRRILELGDLSVSGLGIQAFSDKREHLAPFVECLTAHLNAGEERWQQENQIFTRTGRRVLMCRGSQLLLESSLGNGHVVVFDDITALIKGQRNAAWSEVARRLAHEIKNPLTPIQLSAERLRQKYLAKMAPDDADTLDRLTTTIVQQVETMKVMVNTFSDYARMPAITQERTDLNALISAVVDLYRSASTEVNFELSFDPDLPKISVDAGRLRQVFNNLIKNALEASSEQPAAAISISTRRPTSEAGDHLEILVTDQGDGIPTELIATLFEPYVTTKTRGTGLGLAIVKKIIEEHGGVVSMENNEGRGARATIRLPLNLEDSPGSEPGHRRVA
ncbi:MAG: HAMP domain-containing protein [Gammaproteobacteria bacterium]|nr:HAMP domain-containing protein [Gammaproteobacteria bacterium]